MTEEKKAIPKTLGWLDRPVMVDLADHTGMGCTIRDLTGFEGFMVVEGPGNQPYLINRDQIVTIHPAATPVGEELHIETVKNLFPEDLENLLSFEEKEDYIRVKPRQFLGSDNFAKIASIIRGLDGEYISAGKESHFRLPKTTEDCDKLGDMEL